MKHSNKSTLKETTDSPEDNKDLIKDRYPDPESQKEKEDRNDTASTSKVRGWLPDVWKSAFEKLFPGSFVPALPPMHKQNSASSFITSSHSRFLTVRSPLKHPLFSQEPSPLSALHIGSRKQESPPSIYSPSQDSAPPTRDCKVVDPPRPHEELVFRLKERSDFIDPAVNWSLFPSYLSEICQQVLRTPLFSPRLSSRTLELVPSTPPFPAPFSLSACKTERIIHGQSPLSITTLPFCSQSSIPPVTGSPKCSNEEKPEEVCEVFCLQAESSPSVDNNPRLKADLCVVTENVSDTNIPPSCSHLQFSTTDSCCWTRSHNFPSLSKIPKNNLTRAASLPDMRPTSSYKEFTPDISADDLDDETYRFQCSCPGLYQCNVTGLVFNMKGEGDVVYRTVPWNRRLLAQNDKKPAGPLFDIKCQQQSVCQLHLPHCEILSTGGGQFLQVAHVQDERIEFITPHNVTETHVVINITGFSGYGNVKDEDSPPVPVRALVLLFFRPPDDPDFTSFLNVLLLPKNVALQNVLHTRKKLFRDERYIETSPHCKLHPKEVYALFTAPEDDSVLVQPAEAEFDEESYDNYFPSFQVILERNTNNIKLFIRDSSSSHSVWERQVYLSSSLVKKSCGSTPLNFPSTEKLFNVRSCFITGISEPVLNSLLDKLLDKKVITDAEKEAANVVKIRSEKARFVIDTVRKKGEAASSEMIEFLSELDSFLYEHLGLI